MSGLTKERVAIGHNVGYDRARVKEPYDKCKTYIRFMDTMSMSIPIYGMADHQVSLYEKDDADPDIRVYFLLFTYKDDEIIDPWLWNVDWTVKNGKLYPEWYCKLFTKRKSADQSKSVDDLISGDIVMKSALVPLIFGMVFGPYPLFKTTKYGWGYLVPQVSESSDTLSTSTESSIFVPFRVSQAIVNVVENNKLLFGDMPLPSKPKAMFGPLQFYQLPHPSGSGNVGDPLSKHFFRDIDEDVLRPTRFKDEFSVLLESLKTTRFWTNYRYFFTNIYVQLLYVYSLVVLLYAFNCFSKRFDAEIPVWYDNISEEGMENGAIAPAIVPTGTGIKSMVQAPAGYRLVGADVDSQEQWIAGLFGDASYAKALDPADRHPGLTPFSNMMLAGSKSDGTDLHTVVAKELHINRGQAKTLNYARLYGSGEQHAAKHLKQNGMKERDAVRIARNLFKITKGIETKTMTVEFEDWIFLKAKQEDPNLTKDILICVLYDDYAKTIPLYTGG
uniref:DNA-directed DNA polymerase n=1 Tax=Heterorhabditis bacteriophora TaxID=37862 RepID=A0A1I7XB20_HETBA